MCTVHKRKTKAENYLQQLFTESERHECLDYFNNSSLEELTANIRLGTFKAAKIVKYREKNGNFSALDQLTEIGGIGLVGLKSACKAFLYPDDFGVKKIMKMTLHPAITDDLKEHLEDFVALDIQMNAIYWCKMNRNLQLEDWKETIIFNEPVYKLDHVMMHNKVKEFLDALPDTSAYVMEEKTFNLSNQNQKRAKFLANFQALHWIFITALNLKRDHNVIYSIKPRYIDRTFDIDVCGERVIADEFVDDIFSRKIVGKNTFINKLHIPEELIWNYKSRQGKEKNRLANTLFLGLAFYKHVLVP